MVGRQDAGVEIVPFAQDDRFFLPQGEAGRGLGLPCKSLAVTVI